MEYFSIYFTTIILDFMAYSSHIISKIYHIDSLIGSIEQARIKLRENLRNMSIII